MDASEILHFTWIITLANSCQNIRYSRSQKWYLCTYLTKYVKTVIFVQSSMKTEKTFFCFILNIINHSAIVTICFAKFFISVCSNMRLFRTATFFCCCHYSDVFRCSFSKLQIHLMVKKKKDLWKFQAFIFFFKIFMFKHRLRVWCQKEAWKWDQKMTSDGVSLFLYCMCSLFFMK